MAGRDKSFRVSASDGAIIKAFTPSDGECSPGAPFINVRLRSPNRVPADVIAGKRDIRLARPLRSGNNRRAWLDGADERLSTLRGVCLDANNALEFWIVVQADEIGIPRDPVEIAPSRLHSPS